MVDVIPICLIFSKTQKRNLNVLVSVKKTPENNEIIKTYVFTEKSDTFQIVESF